MYSTCGSKLLSSYTASLQQSFSKCMLCLAFYFVLFFLIMWLSYCTWHKIGPYLLQLLTNGLQRYLLKGPVIPWFCVLLVLKMFFQSHRLLSLHMHLNFFHSSVCYGVVGVITGYFYFIVNVCLFLYRQACRYLLIYVIFFCFVLWIYFQNRFI